jgi:hypothetical protein
MTTPLEHLYQRLDRARKHLENFKRQSKRFTNSIHYEVVNERVSDGDNEFVRVMAYGGKEPPLDLSFIVGDCIHNLRSILDNLVWQLGELSGCPAGVLKNLSFPVCVDSEDFAKKAELFKGFPQTAIDLIESLQPYQGGNDPYYNPLWILNRLWNNDKHRSPVICTTIHKASAIRPREGQYTRLPDGRIINQVFIRHMVIKTGGVFQGSAEIATIEIRAHEPIPQIDYKISFDIAFDKDGPAKGQLVSKFLSNLHDFIRDKVIIPFEPIFPK